MRALRGIIPRELLRVAALGLVLAGAIIVLAHPVLHVTQHSEAQEDCYLCLALHSAQPPRAPLPAGPPLSVGEWVPLAEPAGVPPAGPCLVASRAPPTEAV